jgi:ribosomal protein S18 acetylase RimI-like enzyme
VTTGTDPKTHRRIRRAGPSDAAALARFAAHVFRETYAAFNDPGNLERHIAARFAADLQEREITDPNWQTLLVEAGGALAAYAQLDRGPAPDCVRAITGRPDALEIKRFYVDARWHGLGIAQELMAASLAARGDPHDAVWLGVFSQNPRAIAFYTKCGFRIVGHTTFVLGDDPQQDFVMLYEENYAGSLRPAARG